MIRNLLASYGWMLVELIVLGLAIVELVALRRSMRRSRRISQQQKPDGSHAGVQEAHRGFEHGRSA